MLEEGILDPTKVTRLALQNAASVAGPAAHDGSDDRRSSEGRGARPRRHAAGRHGRNGHVRTRCWASRTAQSKKPRFGGAFFLRGQPKPRAYGLLAPRQRAGSSAVMFIQRFVTSALAMIALALAGCGGGGSADAGGTPAPTAGNAPASDCGTAYIGLMDADGDFTSYTVDVVLPHAEEERMARRSRRCRCSTRVDFAELVDLKEFLTAATVPNGAYVEGTIRLDYSERRHPRRRRWHADARRRGGCERAATDDGGSRHPPRQSQSPRRSRPAGPRCWSWISTCSPRTRWISRATRSR